MNTLDKRPRHTVDHRAQHALLKQRRDVKAMTVASVALLALMSPNLAYADAGFDNASYQGCYDAQTAKANGASFSITKLTEGPGYTNEYAKCQLDANRSAGLRMAAYDFARPDLYGAIQSADNFNLKASLYGLIHAGVIPVLDWESGNLRDVNWAKTWLDRVASYWGTKPLIYMSASVIRMADWTPVASANYGLWVAGYPKGYAPESLRDPGAPPYDVSPWPFAAAWQYSSSGRVPGVGNAVDVDWFYGDAVTWAKYANAPIGTVNNPVNATGSTANGAPTADVNTLATEVIRGEYGNDPQRRALLGDRYGEVMQIVNQRLGYGVSAGGSVYYVKPGDYLSKIWPTDWQRIARLNGLGWPYTIYPGQKLSTDGGNAGGGRQVPVQPGDTLSGIAARLGVPYTQLHGYRSGNPNVIYPGEVLSY